MAKVGQVYHISHDPALHDTETGRKAECRALNITEELGQVSAAIYIKRICTGRNILYHQYCEHPLERKSERQLYPEINIFLNLINMISLIKPQTMDLIFF